jgi:hypothetical protein
MKGTFMVAGLGRSALLSALVLAAGTARAQGGDPGAMAEALFRSGRELMAAGRIAEACPKFAESNRIDPKLGTLMNLALCHEKAGLTASAWAEYLRAASLAQRAGQSERERVAREHATALEGTLGHVVITQSGSAESQVTLDGQPLEAGGFGTPIPLDPGDHVVRATAPGKKAFEESFRIVAGAPDHATRVPALEADATAAAPVQPAPAPASAPAEAPAETHGEGALRIAGFAIGGAGIVLVGVGSFFGVQALSQKHTAESECGATFCTAAGLDATSSMKTSETVSTITMIAGAAAFGTGVALVLAAHSASPVRLGPSGAGIRASIVF